MSELKWDHATINFDFSPLPSLSLSHFLLPTLTLFLSLWAGASAIYNLFGLSAAVQSNYRAQGAFAHSPLRSLPSSTSSSSASSLTCTFTSNTYAPRGNSAWLEANFCPFRRRRRRHLIGFTYWVNSDSSQWFITPSHSALPPAPASFCCGYFLWHVRALRKQTPRMADYMPYVYVCVCASDVQASWPVRHPPLICTDSDSHSTCAPAWWHFLSIDRELIFARCEESKEYMPNK